MSYKDKLTKLKTSLEKEKSDGLVTLAKAFAFAFVAFTFLAGLIFTVIPLARNIYMHFVWHVIEPINNWVATEPVTGTAILFLFKVAAVCLFLFTIRKHLMFIPLWIASQLEKLDGKPKKKPTRKPTTTKPKDVLKAPPT